MRTSTIAAMTVGAVVLGACAGDPYRGVGPREQSGTAIGALAGGLIGSQFGGRTGDRIAAGIAGAAIGGLLGNRIGASLDEEDRQRAYEAQMTAMEMDGPGGPVEWRNPRSGRYGTIIPGPVYVERGTRCRRYTHTVYIGGRPEIASGVACRLPNGMWELVG